MSFFARDISEATDKAVYLTNLRMMGVRFGQIDTSELLKGKNKPERVAARHAYWARLQVRTAKEFMDAMRKRI